MTIASALHPPALPHEHGAWVMLGATAVFGLAAAPRPGIAAWLVLPGLLLLFLARYAALPAALRLTQGKTSPRPFLVRRLGWGAAYVTAAAGLFGVALVLTPDASREAAIASASVVLGLGTLHAGLALAGRDRTAWGELLGMTGLAAGGPLVASAGGVAFGPNAIAPGILALAYFAATLAFVRAYRSRDGRERAAAARSLAAHAAIGAGLAAAAAAGIVPGPAAASFLVVIARAAWGAIAPAPSLRALGCRELAVALTFVVLGVVGLRLGN